MGRVCRCESAGTRKFDRNTGIGVWNMLKRILAVGLMMLCMALPALADAQFSDLFYGEGHDYALAVPEQDVFNCPDAQAVEDFFKTGTGIALLGSPDDSWTRASAALVQEMCARYGIGVIRYIAPDEHAGFAAEVQAYISKWGTSFANVSGTTELIEENTGCGAQEIQGVVLFMNKGTIIGAHVGTVESAVAAAEDVSIHMDAMMEQLYKYVQKLGSSPCPTYC